MTTVLFEKMFGLRRNSRAAHPLFPQKRGSRIIGILAGHISGGRP
jgi:hypothetical protein